MRKERKWMGPVAVLAVAAAGLCVAMILVAENEAVAGNWHQSPKICSDCHVMHASLSDSTTVYNGGAGFTDLLKASSTNKLCLDCHAKNGASPIGTFSVSGTAVTDSWAAGRFGGDAVYTDINTPADHTSSIGHNLEVATNSNLPPGADPAQAWRGGSSPAAMLNCKSCHEPHGNANYRNLSYDPNTNNADVRSCTVTVTPDGPYVSDTGARITEVWKLATANYGEGMSSFCQDCHEKFGPINTYAGPAGGTAGFYTTKFDNDGLVDNTIGSNTHHPIDTDVAVPYATNYNNVLGRDTYPLGKSSGTVPYTDGTNNHIQCVTCHWAHGSPTDFADGLRWSMSGTVQGGGTAACQACHAK